MKNKEAKSIFSSLENFSSVPPPELWDAIEKELDQPKKKKRSIVWWWAAAGLAVGLSISTFSYFNSNERNSEGLDIINNDNGVVFQKASDSQKHVNEHEKEVVKSSGNQQKKDSQEVDFINTKNEESINTAITITSDKTPGILSGKKNSLNFKKPNSESTPNSIAENDDKTKSELVANNKNYQSKSILEEKNSDARVAASGQNKTVLELYRNKQLAEESDKSLSTKDKSSQSNILDKKPIENNSEGLNNNKTIAQNSISEDSLARIKKEVAQLENTLAGKEKKEKKTNVEPIEKWSLQVFAGVASSENYSNEKALGGIVDSKQSSGYGVKTNYKLNKKWAVSSGFKINELGQKMAGVSYYEQSHSQGVVMGAISSADNSNFNMLSAKNKYEIVSISSNNNYLFVANPSANSSLQTGNVTQNLKYFEMPLEVSYAVLSKKKTSINMNTGGFVGKLISNEVMLNGSVIGENKNVNEYVYGTLLSSTLQYEFIKKTKFFIEPGMNYYINPLENQSFNQFQWMFNIGLNVSF